MELGTIVLFGLLGLGGLAIFVSLVGDIFNIDVDSIGAILLAIIVVIILCLPLLKFVAFIFDL